MIPQHIARLFTPMLKARGKDYFDGRRVTDLTRHADSYRARVRGTSMYNVRLSLRYNVATSIHCNCPWFEDHRACKHLWALLLAIDARDGIPQTEEAIIAEHGVALGIPVPAQLPDWQQRLKRVQQLQPESMRLIRPTPTPLTEPLTYRINADHLRSSGEVVLEVIAPDSRKVFTDEEWRLTTIEDDRIIAYQLLGATTSLGSMYNAPITRRTFTIPPAMYDVTLRTVCETGRCSMRDKSGTPVRPLQWDDGGAWHPRIIFALDAEATLRCVIERADRTIALEHIVVITADGLMLLHEDDADVLARVVVDEAWPVILSLLSAGPISAPADDAFDMAVEIMSLPGAAQVDLPESLNVRVNPAPIPHLQIDLPRYAYDRETPVRLAFEYDGILVDNDGDADVIPDRARRRVIVRSTPHEKAAHERLYLLGAKTREYWRSSKPEFLLPAKSIQWSVQTLVAEGWAVRFQGKKYRASTRQEARVQSGIDWFEVEGDVEFDDQHVALPALLAAMRRGETAVLLPDGSMGIMPVDWLRRFQTIAALAANADPDAPIRLKRAQAGLLDMLLEAYPDTDVDAAFARIRDELRTFTSVEAEEAPIGFHGELRGYQKDALGWFSFLRRLGTGGCLADDMGLGKTVQVLALLEQRRQEGAGPSLVVVPKSLVFNWINEAARFTPQLRVRDYTGIDRSREALDPTGFDLVISTYGTLRRDAPELANVAFDYVILDEAQAIKNAKTVSAKAARLLRGTHRLALSGTPIENDLSELWSLFDFLNPGMLGAAKGFSGFRADASNDTGAIGLLARAVRPFMLRRTKEQVAPELPPRTEQTVIVELDKEQRAIYDSLRDHYRSVLLSQIDNVGIKRSKIQILEALLRLRQAAIHPALIDRKQKSAPSAKLDILIDKLEEIMKEGHRALVFSQFTTFLDIVRERLVKADISFEYLDGQTRDRQARVERFQSDPSISVFLISLRAGGHGLNLTAADYVFVLDPWWNPAVEAQAIDRAHRIGQDRHVIALRLIARDTVEEKVLELQRSKRALADAILGADAGLISSITRDDLELLLGS